METLAGRSLEHESDQENFAKELINEGSVKTIAISFGSGGATLGYEFQLRL